MTGARTLVALATYNEIENLPSLVDEILLVLPEARILIVDDSSPDGTGRWCDERAVSEQRVRCLHRAGKQGLGSATLLAARYAIENDYELFVTLDADWSHDPRYLPDLIAASKKADVVIGSRYCPGGSIEGWPWHRRALSGWMNFLTGSLLHLPVRDTTGAFRAYRVAKLREISLNDVEATGYAYLEEILWHLQRVGASFAEIPITFHQRRAGRSKIHAGEGFAKVRTLLRLSRRR
jgi:dolichol-phosphate mannosyltransferase